MLALSSWHTGASPRVPQKGREWTRSRKESAQLSPALGLTRGVAVSPTGGCVLAGIGAGQPCSYVLLRKGSPLDKEDGLPRQWTTGCQTGFRETSPWARPGIGSREPTTSSSRKGPTLGNSATHKTVIKAFQGKLLYFLHILTPAFSGKKIQGQQHVLSALLKRNRRSG